MSEIIYKTPRVPYTIDSNPYTHVAYFFVRTGVRKGRVFGYWKDGGRFRKEEDGTYFAFSDLTPRGWDGRIRFVAIGDPPPGTQVPQRPDADDDHDAGEDSEN